MEEPRSLRHMSNADRDRDEHLALLRHGDYVDERPVAADTSEASERAEAPPEFADFYRSERSRLFGTLAIVTGSRSEAEELVQEAFVRVWERWERVSAHPDPVGYLYRTAFNLVRQRRRAIRRAAARRSATAVLPDPFERADDLADVAAAMRRLTVRQRTAVILTDLLDFDSKEAGRLMRARPGTVRSLASQGRAALRQAMGDDDE